MVNVFLSGSVANSSFSGSVGPVSRVIISPNYNRMSLSMTNDGANTVYLSLGKVAVAGNGVRLNSNGGSFEIHSSNLYQGTVCAVTTSGTSAICFVEMYNQ